jgi:PAS domain S-box-containing protein
MMTSGISKLKIGPRLILCFALIILLMLVGNSLLAWQFRLVNQQSDRVTALAQELAVVSRFQTDLLSVDEKLDSLAKAEDIEGLRQEATRSRSVLDNDIEAVRDALLHLPSDVGGNIAPLPTAEAVETTWSPQLDALIALGVASDWNAVRVRLADEKKPLEARASDLVRSVQQQVTGELIQSVAQSQQIKSRIVLILPLTAFLTLLFAVLLATAITRSITVPLRQLMRGSTALARGDFDHQVQLQGKDELARVGAVFNETSAKLGELYRRLEEAQRITNIGYWIWDLDTNCLTWADETYRIFGLKPQERPIDTKQFQQMVHPEDRERFQQATQEALRNKEARVDIEFRIVRPSGEIRTVQSRGSIKKSAPGQPIHRFGTVQDITDRKRAEEALRSLSSDLQESKVKLEEAQRITHVGYWERDLTTDRISWSDETYRIYGLEPQEHPMDLIALRQKIHPEDREIVFRALADALGGGPRYNVEFRVVRPSGEVRTIHSKGDVKTDASGRRVLMFGTVQDITDRKRADEALRRSQFYLSEGQRLAHMGSWAYGSSGGFDYWSDELFQIYGRDPRKGAPTLDEYLSLLHVLDRDSMAETIKTMHRERIGCDVKKRIVGPNGELRYVRCVGIPVIEGEVLKGFLGTAMDITDQELLTQELERQRAYLTEAQRLTHTGSWVWRVSDRSAVHLSEEWYRIFEFNPADGAPDWETRLGRVHPEDRLLWKGTLDRSVEKKSDYDLEFRIVVPSGIVKWLRTVGHPVFSDARELIQFVGTSTDITERKSAEQERERLHQLEGELLHTNRMSMLGEMAATLAHEIKQPIAAAINSANSCIEWLAHEPPNLDRARAAAGKINKYGNRAAEIIDRIRSFYRKAPPRHELLNVNPIIFEILTLLEGEANRSSVAMRTDLAPELPEVVADRVQLQQVFMNLMLNAIEAMKNSGGELVVKSQMQQDGQPLFSVSDTGPGLPAESVEQIFSAFFTTKPQGSGMGLAISRTIVESHGGRLWASTNDGTGAAFHFTLPTDVR